MYQLRHIDSNQLTGKIPFATFNANNLPTSLKPRAFIPFQRSYHKSPVRPLSFPALYSLGPPGLKTAPEGHLTKRIRPHQAVSWPISPEKVTGRTVHHAVLPLKRSKGATGVASQGQGAADSQNQWAEEVEEVNRESSQRKWEAQGILNTEGAGLELYWVGARSREIVAWEGFYRAWVYTREAEDLTAFPWPW